MEALSYRPRNAGHDYYGRGTYLITLVVSGREQLLSHFVAEIGHKAILVLTPLGKAVQEAWLQTPAHSQTHGNKVVVHACVCMPDHFHGVIEVLEPMQWSLGDIIQAFKANCTSWWQQQQVLPSSTNRPISDDCKSERAPAWLLEKAALHYNEGALIRSMSKKQRQEYYTLVGRQLRPLFDDNYDDTVCLDERHRQAMIAYVHDNPRRAQLRRLLPDYMRRCLHVQIGGRSYGAFGNLFLLRWPRKVQVMCHRKHPVSCLPYEETDDYARERSQWEATEYTTREDEENFKRRLDSLIDESVEIEGEEGRKLFDTFRRGLAKHREHIFLFLSHHDVPYDNNGSERAVRPVKTKLKVSGQFRSDDGSKNYATLMSIALTAKKNNQNPFFAFQKLAAYYDK